MRPSSAVLRAERNKEVEAAAAERAQQLLREDAVKRQAQAAQEEQGLLPKLAELRSQLAKSRAEKVDLERQLQTHKESISNFHGNENKARFCSSDRCTCAMPFFALPQEVRPPSAMRCPAAASVALADILACL